MEEPSRIRFTNDAFESAFASVTDAQQRLLAVLVEYDHELVWQRDGCRSFAHWISMKAGISVWMARRWINAAYTLPFLPLISDAFEQGRLSLEKVVELCRFATPDNEKKLLGWARRVTVPTIRERGDLANRPDREQVVDSDRNRYLNYWWSLDGTTLGLEGAFPADQGAMLAQALDRAVERVPTIVDAGTVAEEATPEASLDLRRADALIELAMGAMANAEDGPRVTLVVHAQAEALVSDGGCEIEGGPVINAETARRLSCDARLQVVEHDESGKAIGIGRTSRTVPAWLARELRHRDRCCTFPGCGSTRFLHAHHIEHWAHGGRTDLDNLVLVCSFHHKLVHEYGWMVQLVGVDPRWLRPDGRPFFSAERAEQGRLDRAPPVRELEPA